MAVCSRRKKKLNSPNCWTTIENGIGDALALVILTASALQRKAHRKRRRSPGRPTIRFINGFRPIPPDKLVSNTVALGIVEMSRDWNEQCAYCAASHVEVAMDLTTGVSRKALAVVRATA